MSNIISGPTQIVKDGLVFYLDAGNKKSYPGSGTTWSDISGYRNNGTLINGPTFDSSNGGSIVFDGVNDYIGFDSLDKDLIQGKTNITIGIWFKLNTIGVLRGLIGTLRYNCVQNLGLVSSNGNLSMYNDTTTCYAISLSNYVTTGIWIFAVGTYDGLLTKVYGYKNGVKSVASGNGKTGPTNVFNYPLEIMKGSNIYSHGSVGSTFIYNRTLTDEEIDQNYNATKSRYGL